MAISDEKLKIVINNYFKSECDVNTSIREAFEKGFRIGVKKGLMQIGADRKTENCSEFPNNCETCKHNELVWYSEECDGCSQAHSNYEPQTSRENTRDSRDNHEIAKDEPQTEVDIARAIVHKMIDNSEIAEDAYPDLRQRLHDAVDEYEPQTERSK